MSFNSIFDPMVRAYFGNNSGSGGSGGMAVCLAIEPTKATRLSECEGMNVRFPNATSIGEWAFNACDPFTSVDLPAATSIGKLAFESCTSLTSVDLPVVAGIGNYAFSECTALTSVDLPVVAGIGDYAFNSCTSLDTLILRKSDSICNLSVTVILGTKIATAEGMPTGEGFVYVPAALFEDYVANFVTQLTLGFGLDEATAEYMTRVILRKIEDYPEICG